MTAPTPRDVLFELESPIGELKVLADLLIDQTSQRRIDERDWNTVDYLAGRIFSVVKQAHELHESAYPASGVQREE